MCGKNTIRFVANSLATYVRAHTHRNIRLPQLPVSADQALHPGGPGEGAEEVGVQGIRFRGTRLRRRREDNSPGRESTGDTVKHSKRNIFTHALV